MNAFLDLPALSRAAGVVDLPGSKSISNRMLLLAALARGTTEIRDLLDSDDTRVMLAALRALGVVVVSCGAHTWRVTGAGGAFPVKAGELFLGNAGTAVRSLTAALALSGGRYTVTGVARMQERPIADLVDGLRQIGADVRYAGREGFPPLTIFPALIDVSTPVRVRGDVSSQFLTGLLLALPLLGKAAVVEVTTELISRPYVDITLNLMARFGVKVACENGRRFVLSAGAGYTSPGVVHVEGDASSASYFLAAGAVAGGPVRVCGVGKNSIQGDVRFADELEKLGAQITWGENFIEARGPGERLRAFDLDCSAIPDAAMTLAVVALFTDGPCTLRNIGSWRVKETDRIAAMATELRKLGAQVEEGADWLKVFPFAGSAKSIAPAGSSFLIPDSCPLIPEIDTYDDHRIAMCFSLAALAGRRLRINDPGCVAKTFPDYFAAFGRLVAPVIAIDGPSASGKGTVAQRVAQALGFHYLDSGALYRLVALAAQRAGVDFEDAAKLAALAAELPAEFVGERILLAGEEVTEAIRSEAIGMGASRIAALPAVRAALLSRQRAFCRLPGLVADGRDMGSVVFAHAPVKIFLTASADARAQRRYKQLMDKGLAANMRDLLHDLEARDARDAARSVAPLRQAEDAELVDTTSMNIGQAVDAVLDIARRKIEL